MLGLSNEYSKEIINLLEESIVERKGNICDTWDTVKVMSLPWGVKDFIEPEHAEEFTAYVLSIVNKSLELPSGNIADILKGDVKEKKGKFLLIMRYELSKLA